MSKNVKNISVLLEHSEAKVQLLGSYLDRYLGIISNDKHTEKIFLYDLFCGEGLYENGGKGSPIIILEKVKNLYFINKAKNSSLPPIDMYFNDVDSEKIINLKNSIKKSNLYYDEFGSISFESKDYQKVLPQVIDKCLSLRKQKAFVFIDPYGYKHIRASDIKKIIDTKKAEVLLFLPTQFMYRFDEGDATPVSLIDILDEIADYKKWRTKSGFDFISKFKDALRSYIGEENFVDTFYIQKDKNTLFCLFFFTSHIRGFEKMLEAKWALDEDRGVGFRYNIQDLDLFGMNSAVHPLENEMLKYLKQGSKNNSDVYKFVLHNGYLPTHATKVLTSIQQRGILQVKSMGDDKIKKGAFYINYKCFRDEPSKVTFEIR